jgi:Fe-S-cluster-containing hydrogenase component 2
MSQKESGYLTVEELKEANQYPSEERFNKGPIVIAECIQEIPCNPCEDACKFGAIKVGNPITSLPKVDEDKCTGCTLCVAQCPGLALFVVDNTFSKDEGTVSFPYEYNPLPEVGQIEEAVDRTGTVITECKVEKVLNPQSFDRTPVITVSVPKEYTEIVRGIKRKGC